MSTPDFYDALAPLYHFNFADWSASIERQGRALEQILAGRGIAPGSRVLDAACGIGTQTLALALRGFRMTGSDISPGAVARARQEADSRSLAMDLSVCDIRSLTECHRQRFDAVIACDNAIPHLLSDDDVLRALEQMHGCTRPGGVALISVRDYAAEDRSTALQARPAIVHTVGDERRIVFQVWAFENDRYELSLYMVEDDPAREPSVQVMRTHYYAVSTDRLVELMQRAGFIRVERLDEPFYQPIIIGDREVA